MQTDVIVSFIIRQVCLTLHVLGYGDFVYEFRTIFVSISLAMTLLPAGICGRLETCPSADERT